MKKINEKAKKKLILVTLVIGLLTSLFFAGCIEEKRVVQRPSPDKLYLRDGWAIKSSAKVEEAGETISTSKFKPEAWYPTSVPSTVLAALVKNGACRDPYFGTNMESIPGYRSGIWRTEEMPSGSPFRVPWWYRVEFELPKSYEEKNIWLHLHSINYKANVWLNGHLIANSSTIEGTYRLFDLDITGHALPGKTNCLALEIFPPRGMDLSISWVDWNPTPPDRAMGIWYDVRITTSGSVAMRNPHVVTDLDLPSLAVAQLIVSVELTNMGDREIEGTLNGKIEDVDNRAEGGTSRGKGEIINLSQRVNLAPKETKLVTFSPDKFPGLNVRKPRLWWPNPVGPQNLYDLSLDFKINEVTSDAKNVRFGIREVSCEMKAFDGKLTRVFQINGKNVLVRGGGYVEDMMLRPSSEREEIAVSYAKAMNLNALRMEGVRGSNYLYDLCDKQGIMTFVGWCCCSAWESWENWTEHTAYIAEKSLKDEVIRLRNHPCVIDWLYGSDRYPPADVERRYISVLDEYDGTRPYQSSATSQSSDIAGATGLYMGPWPDVYAYLPPSYWYGKLEFNTEAGPSGEQIPPIESMRKMMPEDDLWPTSDSWRLRLSSRFSPQMREALNSRYGKPTGLEEYCIKSQVLQKEATKAMFEAYARNKYGSSGIIYWMFNSAWPSLYWQLYDYYLMPNGAFYGTKEACNPLHVQYSYDDDSVWVVNSYYHGFKNLKVTARVYNFGMTEKYSKGTEIDVQSDSNSKAFTVRWPRGLTRVHFLKLELRDETNNLIDSNFYWLSTKRDRNADFTQLMSLPSVDLEVSCKTKKQGDTYAVYVDLKNPSSNLAFAINPKIKKSISRDLVLPIYWEDNYFSLLPGERRVVKVEFNVKDFGREEPLLIVDGWNIKTEESLLH
ncbi:MAG TPA: hypothetical protein HA348_00025 [Thermoplasmata archaeon]|nr:hypothetical protein [Thermoplasmata archaeon]